VTLSCGIALAAVSLLARAEEPAAAPTGDQATERDNRYNAIFSEARKYYQNAEYAKATDAARMALTIKRTDEAADLMRDADYSRYYAKASALYKDNDYAQALATANMAQRIKDTLEVHGLIAIIQRAQAGDKTAVIPAWIRAIPYRLVYETYRDNNWELFSAKADGSDPVNLTKTPDVNEMYPHVSPDGTKIAFLVNAGKGEATRRSAWYMNLDGSGRTKVADDVREVCWSWDGKTLALLPALSPTKYVDEDFASHGLTFYDMATGKITPHVNKDLDHLLGLTYAPGDKWFLATVYGGMGYSHTSLAFEVQGTKVFDLHISGCRPDLTADGKRLAWGSSVSELSTATIDLGGETPKLTNKKVFVTAAKGMKVYHIDWSPDGKYVAFCTGPEKSDMGAAPEQPGVTAPGWNLCVGNIATGEWAQITFDGKSNKEPDWVPVKMP
jgi:tetratricopeptide (TPR) repeat protein